MKFDEMKVAREQPLKGVAAEVVGCGGSLQPKPVINRGAWVTEKPEIRRSFHEIYRLARLQPTRAVNED